MDRQSVYLETSVIGYAASRRSRDLIVAAHQQITQDWFASQAGAYDIFISQLVVREISAGDKNAAEERLAFIQNIPLLSINDEAGALAAKLVEDGAVPPHAVEDALHIAAAAVHGVDFLLTWNCRHIANAAMRFAIETTCRNAGCEPPTICTPEELTHEH